jgi:SAM-dependent methyltransferase
MELTSPLTGTPDVRLVKQTPTTEVIRNWREHLGIDVQEELRGVTSISLFECLRSHLRFFVPRDAAGSTQLYQQLQRLPWYYMPEKWEHRIAIEDLRPCRRVLEIGCGTGEFIQRLRHLGLNVEGIELNEDAVAAARRSGLPVHRVTLSELARIGRQFDAICAFQVLEHVPNPKTFLADALGLLSDGGRLILSVPNSDAFIRHARLDLLNEPPHHMTQWNERALRFLTQILPIELDHVNYEPLAAYHIDWYVSVQLDRFLSRIRVAHRLLRPAFHQLLRSERVRRTIRGHTVYARFHKLPPGTATSFRSRSS